MPIYEYECDECGHVTEALRKMSEADAAIECQCCGGKRTHRAQSVFAASSGQSSPTPGAGACGTCGDPNPAPM